MTEDGRSVAAGGEPGTSDAGPAIADGGLRFRRPVEADHRRMVEVVDAWWGGRPLRHLLPRLWLQHFTGTSLIAELPDGSLAGFLVGFVSPDHPELAYVHLVATNPEIRRRGIGRQLYARFARDVSASGVRRLEAITWPGNRTSLAFHAALGFRPVEGPGTRPVDGTSAYPDYEGDGADRTVMRCELGERGLPA